MFLREYVRMLIVVGGAMIVYFLTINQWVQWRPEPPKQVTKSAVTVDFSDRWWSVLYKKDDWQNQQPQRLLLKRAEILFQTVENLGLRRYKLQPLSIVLPQSDAATGEPNSAIVIECPAGAEVQSESDMGNAMLISQGTQSTSLSSVHFEGEVTIRSVPLANSNEQANRFVARTSHLKIDGNRIHSSQEISLRFGNSIFEGRDFVFTSSSDILERRDANPQNKQSPFAGLDHLEIIYVNRIEIELANGGLLKKQVAPRYVGREIPPSQMLVQCKKSFHFDFQKMIATLNDRVVMRHVFSGFPIDQIEADRVDLHFEYKEGAAQPEGADVAVSKGLGQIKMSDGAMTLEQIAGYGKSTDNTNEESRWIAINAPNFMTECTTRWIKVAIDDNTIELANQLPTEKSIESSPVYLHRDDLRVWTPKLIYKMNPASKDDQAVKANEPEHLGSLWAQGPGEATMTTKEGESWTANWSNSLVLRPDKDEDLVSLDGAAQVRSDRQGRFSAEKLEIWIKSFSPNGINAPEAEKQSAQFLPTRLQAFKDVIVASNALRAQVAELRLWFAHIFPPPAPSGTARAMVQQPAPTSVAANPPISQPTIANPQMSMVAQSLNASQPLAPSNSYPNRPLFTDATTVTGATLEAKLVLPPEGDPIIEHLLLQGDVTMTKERVSESFALPATVTGDKVVVERGEADDLVFHIFGQPAKVLIGGGNVIGNSIHFDQQRQFLYIPEAGELTIPPEMISPASERPSAETPMYNGSLLNAPPLMNKTASSSAKFESNWLENPRLTWAGQMEFDGHLARFAKNIAIRGVFQSEPATLWHLEALGDDLYVEVSGNAFDQKNKKEPSKVQSVQLQGNVDVKAAQTDMNLARKSLEHLRVPVLTVFPVTQTLTGAGPGSLLSRRFSGTPSGMTPPAYSNDANPLLTSKQESLDCLHLTFTDKMEGFYAQSFVKFSRSVAAIMGPIRDWSDALDVDRINMPAPGQSRLETQELSVYSTKGLQSVQQMERDFPGSTKAAWEIVAQGNLIVDSNTEQGVINVTADSGRYNALYEILRVSGAPHRLAHINKQASAAQPNGVSTDMQEGLFNLKTGEMQVTLKNTSGGLPNRANPNQPPQSPAGRPVNAAPPPSNQPTIQSPRDFQFLPSQQGYR